MSLMCLNRPMKTIEIALRELHARTGHYVRKAAARQRIIITDRGKRVAELQSLDQTQRPSNGHGWRERLLDPEFAAIVDEAVGGVDSTRAVSEDRDRGVGS